MKSVISKTGQRAFTLAELAFGLLAFLVLAAYLVVLIGLMRSRAGKINCAENLKIILLANRLWDGNAGDYPTHLSTNEGGTLEFIPTPETFRHFVALSRVLTNENYGPSTPKVFVCPRDSERTTAKNFSTVNNSNLSYFINLDATGSWPQEWMVGDRNLDHSAALVNFSYPLTSKSVVGWKKSIHYAGGKREGGNIAFADGSVQYLTTQELQESLKKSETTNRISIP